jgi:hypothetical protein
MYSVEWRTTRLQPLENVWRMAINSELRLLASATDRGSPQPRPKWMSRPLFFQRSIGTTPHRPGESRRVSVEETEYLTATTTQRRLDHSLATELGVALRTHMHSILEKNEGRPNIHKSHIPLRRQGSTGSDSTRTSSPQGTEHRQKDVCPKLARS